MTRHVALLHGVNVGGRRRLPMSDVRGLFESKGFSDVSSYIQSGNVLFSSSRPVSSVELRAALAEQFGVDVEVILRTTADLRRIVAVNPFHGADPRSLHVGFLLTAPDSTTLSGLDLGKFSPEAAAVRDTEIFLHLPNGIGRAKLPAYAGRRLEIPMTVRNWNTTTRLLELIQSR